MAASINIDRQFDRLENQYRHILAIIAWDDLALAETEPRVPPGFVLQTSIRQSLAVDLQDAEAEFNRLAEVIQFNLQRHNQIYSYTQLHDWHTRLNQVLQKIRNLHLETRY